MGVFFFLRKYKRTKKKVGKRKEFSRGKTKLGPNKKGILRMEKPR